MNKYRQAAFFYFVCTVATYALILYDFWDHLRPFWNRMVWPIAGLVAVFIFFFVMVYRGGRHYTLFLFWIVLLRGLGFFWKLPGDTLVWLAALFTFAISYGLARAIWNLPPD